MGWVARPHKMRDRGAARQFLRRWLYSAGSSIDSGMFAVAHDLHNHDLNKMDSMDRTGRILVVDDESNARAALVELLREEGYSVEGAADGFKALGKLAEFAP